mgnify:CR=1 FL=1
MFGRGRSGGRPDELGTDIGLSDLDEDQLSDSEVVGAAAPRTGAFTLGGASAYRVDDDGSEYSTESKIAVE